MLPDSPSGPGGDLFAIGGEAGRIMAVFDWSTTPLGPVEGWPASLRFAIRSVLVSRLPMVLAWGPEFIQFYNDAYAPLIGAQHPAIGQDIRITFAAGWDVLGPPIEHAMTTLEPSWFPALPLLLERHGYREETFFRVTHAPVFDDDGAVRGMLSIGLEVTGEVVGARRQRLLHELAATTGDLGDEAQVVRAMCEKLGGDPLDVPFAAAYLAGPDEPHLRLVGTVGCDAADLPAVTEPDAAEVVRALGGLALPGGPWGDPVTESVVLSLAGSPGAAPVGVLVVGRSPNLALDDEYRSFHGLMAAQFAGAVATSRAIASQRRRAEALAELDRAKTTFFSDVSHELRTPLTLLLGPISDALDRSEGLPAEVREELELALRNGRRLQRLVNDLLDFASIEAGRAHPVRVRTDVATFTAELAGIFRAAAERAGLRLTVDCPPVAGPSYVDPRMWEKIVVNLLANAVKYTFVGGIDVGLTSDESGFRLTVRDTGVGIVAEELPHLFERFHRVAGATARTREGTGIGLALVQELTALHGGTVSVVSEPGVGSTFTVALPYGAPDPSADEDRAAAQPSEAARGEAASWEDDTSRPGEPAPGGSLGAHVLVVDDNADMRSYLARLLGAHWAVRTTANGEEALRAVAERQPDVVLTDVMMPRIDGFELLRALRSDPATRHIPVIMLTARAGLEASVEGLEAGVDDYLAKPFRADELIARVRVVLERATGRTGPIPLPVQARTDGFASVAAAPVVPTAPLAAAAPAPRPPADPTPPEHQLGRWRLPAEAASVPVLRRGMRAVLAEAGVDPDRAYDLLLAAGEAATNAIEHAQRPSQPFVDVTVGVRGDRLEIVVRDYGQWRERVPSMDRGRGSTLMSAFADVTAVPSPTGTTVVIRSPLA
ncbi:Signal transduction histidine kinase [Blastococcus aurantiacus]|uniref:histidine kinase n=1 Tax=Blastococcus aurantiacus TaxID=1550231 RepID=A0A1G7JUN5_9ACTN|nr:ATP-binding protein [Blastococcus aurantiacus]SDF28575.1 Signal transduction histidine kinase [Blastococcus aurantiacus]